MILVWGLILVFVVLLVRAIAGGFPSGGKSARQVLDDRFARGEIDQREYEERRRLLE
jgi:putative membrane protein